MKRKIIKWLFRLSKKVIAINIVNYGTRLTPEYLTKRGWIAEYDEARHKMFYVEPNIKDRDKIFIEFENHYYRVWHSSSKTFIALETTVEWFELYYLLAHPDNGIYKLAGI